MDREKLASILDALIEKAFYGEPAPPARKTWLRASSAWPGFVVETERLPGDCTCPKYAIFHRSGCPAFPAS